MLGESPTSGLMKAYAASPFGPDIHFLNNIDDDGVQLAYSGATLLIYPSLAEGFGWPIIEAMASGCPVVTTNEAPMTEVAGDAGFFISRRPNNEYAIAKWAAEAASVVNHVIELTSEKRKQVVEAGLENAKRFNSQLALNLIETIYQNITDKYRTH